jgi:hypothetical protein
MAFVDWVYGMKEIILSGSVGKGGANQRGDVIVVQALMKYALEGRPFFASARFSDPSGVLDPNTGRLIARYQQFLRRIKVLRVSVDGRIDPGVRGRNPGLVRRTWTIDQLNGHALEAWALKNSPNENYISDICSKYPIVKSAIGHPPLDSLHVGIEMRRDGVGTLGLTLE